PSPQLKPCSVQATIRLHVSRLSDLPDVSAHISFLKKLEEGSRTPVGSRYSTVFREAAQSMRLEAGLWLPIELQEEVRLAQGVLRLDDQFFESTFASTIFLSEELLSLQAGTLLRRVVEWEEDRQPFEIDEVIGEVVSSRPSCAPESSLDTTPV